jgi:predicted DsbA family dithiol-disulfide isomerase
MAAGPRRPELEHVPSVPLLAFNKKISVCGAQPVGVLLEAMGEAVARAEHARWPSEALDRST